MTVDALRTPEARFAELQGYAYAPHYLENLPRFEGLRLHYLDVRPPRSAVDAQTFLCLHGEPTWAYLYRRMIPIFLAAGHRVVAPDYFGFGRSDKPSEEGVYTFGFHRNTLTALIERLDLRNITLVVQDWGGLLGLTLPMDYPERVARLLVMNTTLATGQSPGPGFDNWKAFVKANPDLAVGRLMKRACPHMSDAEAAAYDAPFPDASYKAGVRRFPELVMVSPEMEGAELSRRARVWLSTGWNGQSFMAVGMQDPVLGPPVMAALRATIRGCPPPFEIADGGHFLQEWGEAVARAALESFARG